MAAKLTRSAIPILNRVICPHCWHRFAAEDALWISQHPDLVGDPRLGADQQQRFLPTRFNPAGAAIDARGIACFGLACPQCHLEVPRALFELEPMFLSVLGTPSCGKSYFLASMTWQLRNTLPRSFFLSFGEAAPGFNHYLNSYEELQFLNPDQDRVVALNKTEEQGDLYNTVLFGDQQVSYPRPFLFKITSLEKHPNHKRADKLSRNICLYDNAGESFLPGADTLSSPVTRHLAQSRALFFCFDPTQDLRFRQACRGLSQDVQMAERAQRLQRESMVRQDTVLHEAADRVRRYAGIAHNARHPRPLVVVVTKYDAWSPLLDNFPLEPPWYKGRNTDLCGLDVEAVEEISARVRNLLWQLTPELVSAAEGFAQDVIYIPVSATGRSPEVDPQTGAQGFRPRDIHPRWVEVPLLYVLARWFSGIIPVVSSEYRQAHRAGKASVDGHDAHANHRGSDGKERRA